MKRYDLETHGRPYMQREEMTERPDGEWVRYEDVEPLIAALRAYLYEYEGVWDTMHGQSPKAKMVEVEARAALAKLGETP